MVMTFPAGGTMVTETGVDPAGGVIVFAPDARILISI